MNSDGWLTSTTKHRMNQFSPLHVYQNKGKWFISNVQGSFGEPIPFEDGMTLEKKITGYYVMNYTHLLV